MQERCILPICLSIQSEPHEQPCYIPISLPLELHFRGYGFGLERATRWNRPYIEIDRVKSWLEICQNHHGKNCNTILVEATLPAGFRLIDTFSMCVREHPSPTTFVALSYSTGQKHTIRLERATQAQLEKENGLNSNQLPDVIVDAIQLCRDIGQRYLWVDRLCIIQDDGVSKHAQIKAMDRIYRMAVFTIVAATNTAPGLPGTSCRPRADAPENPSWALQLDESMVAWVQPRMINPFSYQSIDYSPWNTRGWTYQERMLSRRHLVFCDEHIFLSCFYNTEEDDLVNSECSFSPDAPNFEKGLRVGTDGNPLYRYKEYVKEYTGRTLSFPQDILKAFAGIENVLARQLKTGFLLGLPESSFLETLLWHPAGHLTARDKSTGMPSWSWAGWDGCVTYDHVRIGKNLCTCRLHTGSLARFHYWDPNIQVVRPVAESTAWIDDGNLAESDGRTGPWFYCLKALLRSDYLGEDSSPTWRQCPQNPWNAPFKKSFNGHSYRRDEPEI
ncbi:heterokaryon incompatibility protein-domain-containing protein [Fusarium solani]|uniref:Heterokaryon incompatibility protein-domain-containing protein n=1 Tax=Fusarium solani TaxID=169388 RepID=A0A9P9GYY7_FUSSL|nr:heterokaryon incompatibility protein-domain-containing protein [Fusarium solani]KAH7247224.1 heterokaryon incompatibility protein-domain-containing protein [Fusarium solani]